MYRGATHASSSASDGPSRERADATDGDAPAQPLGTELAGLLAAAPVPCPFRLRLRPADLATSGLGAHPVSRLPNTSEHWGGDIRCAQPTPPVRRESLGGLLHPYDNRNRCSSR